jgi:multiple sugar transport system ATP-binding protein
MANLRLEGLGKTYSNGVRALDAVTLDVGAQELVVLVGPSGCGKTTLLRLIAGLTEATTGVVRLGGKDVTALPPGKRNIAMVFQNYALYPFKTVYENLAFGLRMRGVSGGECDRLVRETAARLQLGDLLQRYPAKLSGGQQQRVALGRALVRRPELFLFDEPLSNLDVHLRRHLRREIKRLQRESATAAIYVTHDQEEAMSLGDRLVVMYGGRVMQVGAPREIYEQPANRFVACFFGSPPMNFLSGTIDRQEEVVWRGAGSSLSLCSPVAERLQEWTGRSVVLGFRPDAVRLSSEGTGLTLHGRVGAIEPLGEVTDLSIILEEGMSATARIRGEVAVGVNEPVTLQVQGGACQWFSADGDGVRLG